MVAQNSSQEASRLDRGSQTFQTFDTIQLGQAKFNARIFVFFCVIVAPKSLLFVFFKGKSTTVVISEFE